MGLHPDQPLAPSAHFVYQRPRRDVVWGWVYASAWFASAVLGFVSFVHRRGRRGSLRGGAGGARCGGGGALRRDARERLALHLPHAASTHRRRSPLLLLQEP